MKLQHLIPVFLLCISFNAFGGSNVEFFGLTGWSYISPGPGSPYYSDWAPFLAGGTTIPITKRLAVEGEIGKRRQFMGAYTRFSTKSNLSWLIGSIAFDIRPTAKVRPYGIGGFGLLHIAEDYFFSNPPFDITSHTTYNHLRISFGGGAKFFFSQHFGLRSEFQFIHDACGDSCEPIHPDIGHDFQSINVGVVAAL